MRRVRPQSVKDWMVSIAGLTNDYRFTAVSEITGTRAVTSFNDGVSPEQRKMVGNITYGDVTLSKPYERDYDAALIGLFQDCNGTENEGFTITCTPVDNCGQEAVGTPIVMVGCIPTSFSLDAIDRNGDSVMMLNLTFSPVSIK